MELKSCPFCGEQPTYYAQDEYAFTYIGGWSSEVQLSCCITMDESYGEDGQFKNMAKTAKDAKHILFARWNKRVV